MISLYCPPPRISASTHARLYLLFSADAFLCFRPDHITSILIFDTNYRFGHYSSPLNRYIFWADWGMNAKIESARMDGTGRQAIITEHIGWPNGLVIDYESLRIFWCEARYDTIYSARLDGTNRVPHVSGQNNLKDPFAITVFGDYIYWTDR